MLNNRLLVLLALCFVVARANAQFSGGFIAGLNFSKLVGPSEVDDNGNDLEQYDFKTGFHLGGRFNYALTDMFGLRGEFLYTQKGTQYNYSGQSYWIFKDELGNMLYSTGDRNTGMKVVNNYLEIPIMAYYRYGRVEVSGGVYAAYLFRATSSGELKYKGVSELGTPIDEFTISLLFNYFTDTTQPINADDTQPVNVDGDIVQVPEVIGSRYNLTTDVDDRLFNRFDYGVIGSVAVYLNQGLFISGRINYGLADLTREASDISRKSLDDNNLPIFLDDNDRNLTIQASLGFSF